MRRIQKHIPVFWAFNLGFAVVLTSVDLPLGFLAKEDTFFFTWPVSIFVSAMFFIDIILQKRFFSKKDFSTLPSAIRKKELAKQRSIFWIDILSIFPYEYFGPIFIWARIIRFVRVPFLWEDFTHSGRAKFFAVLGFVFTGFHWIACLWMALHPMAEGDFLTQYVEALYWTITTMTTIGYGDVIPHGIVDRIFAMTVMLIGVGLYGTIIGYVSSLLTEGQRHKELQKQKKLDLKRLLDHYHVPDAVQNQVIAIYDHLTRQRFSEDDSKIIADLPKALQEKIQVFMNVSLLKRVPMFSHASQNGLLEIADNLKKVLVSPGETIIKAGDS